MLRVENLSVAIGPVAIVRDASLEVCDRAMCGLIGRNGAGKTTLLRGLMGAVAASGKADLDGVDLIGLPSHRRLAHGVGYMPEDRRLAAVLADLKSEGLSILIAESNQIHVAELLSDAYRIERGQVTRA